MSSITARLGDLPIEWKRGAGLRRSDIIEDGNKQCILYGELFTKHKRVLVDKWQLSKTNKTGKVISKKGDILVPATSTASRYEMVLAREVDADGILLGGDINIIRPKEGIFAKKYLPYFFETLSGYRQLDRYITGSTGIIHISNAGIKNLEIRLPTLEEQEKIVSKIEELFSEIDNSTNNLNVLPQLIDTLYQSRLKKIFLGYDSNQDLFNSKDLYQHIVKYRKQAPNTKRLNLNLIQDTELPDLGSRGFWASVDLLALNYKHAIKAGPFGSSLKKSMYSQTGYKLYGQEQVIRQQYDHGDYFIPEEIYQELITNKVCGGDALISLVGTIGKVLVLPEGAEPGIINPRLVKISFNTDHYLPKLFKYYFESQFVKNIYKLKTHGATMDVLNLGIIRTIPIPVFPIMKQHEMLASIEELQTEIENLSKELSSYKKSSKYVKQSILSQAFKGDLV